MAVIVRDTTKNGSMWREWATLLNAVIYDADAQQNSYDDLVNALANVDKSDRWAEKSETMGGLGDFDVKAEGANATEDEFVEGYAKLLEHITFSKTVTITKELKDDNKIADAKQKAINLVQAYKRTRAKFLSQALVSSVGSTTTMSFGTKTGIDITGADNLALFHTAHTLKSLSGETVSNLYADALTEASLLGLSNKMRNFVDDRGEVLGFDADTVIIPGNAPQLERLVKAIIGSDGEVATNNNDINTERGKWKLIVDYLWTPTVESGKATPYILMSSKANKELLATRFFDRTPLDIANDTKVESRNLVYNGFGRFSAGFTNWRHVIMGGSAVEGASTL